MRNRAVLEVVLLLVVVAVGAALLASHHFRPAPDCEVLRDDHLLRVSAPFADVRWPPFEVDSFEDSEEDKGRREADEELRLGVAHVYDLERTGLPELYGNIGCTGPSPRQQAHDQRVLAYIQQYGLPRNTRKQWLPVLSDIPAYVSSHVPVHLRNRYESTRAPAEDANVTLLSLSPLVLRTGLRGETLDLHLDEDTAARDAWVWWGPRGSETILVRGWTASIKQSCVVVCDLRSGRIMYQDFVDLQD